MAVKKLVSPERFVGLSTDTKPTDGATSVRPGATFLEYDTGALYVNYDGTNWVVKPSEVVKKTVETELQALATVAADVQDTSSTLALAGMKQVTIFVDHAKDNASASVGQGTEYVIQVSQAASGNDTWRSLVSFTAAITAPTAMVSDAQEAAGQTVIECGATVPAVGDILFFKNSTLGSSEWSNVVARVTTGGSETVTLESGLTAV